MSGQIVHYRKDYQQSAYRILSTHLTFDLREHETLVTNVMEFERVSGDETTPLILDGEGQELFTLKRDDQDVARDQYEWSDTALTLRALPKRFKLEIVSRIHPESNTSCEGLYKTQGTFCTQCESHGFRKITFYLDRPDVMAFFTTKIIADKQRYPILLSNGNLIAQGDLELGRHFVVWEDPFKKPSYLFALVAGDIQKIEDTFTTLSGRIVKLEIYAKAQYISQCDYAMQALKEAMHWDEVRFGREYDLDIYMIYAAEDFNMGAMENKGLNVFNTKYVLTDPALSTDFDYMMTQAVIGHEYFHNWTGNRITCRDWFQLSLKEGLTVFRDAEFTADYHDRTIKRIEDATYMRTQQFPEDRSPMAHPIRPDSYVEMNNFYTVTVYEKGCEVIRMMHTLLGETGFRKGMDLYFHRHDGEAVTCDDFVNALGEANQYDFTLFKNWYAYSGTPVVRVSASYDTKNQTYTLHFEQSGSALFHIPIRLGLVSKAGKVLPFENEGLVQDELVYSLKTKQANLVLTHVTEIPIPSLLRDFSAPVKLDYPYSEDDLKQLAEHDPNLFNRWDAKERLFTQLLIAAYHNEKVDHATAISVLRTGLRSALRDPAYIAEFLSVPSLKTLADALQNLDPAKLTTVREALLNEVAASLHPDFLTCYEACKKREDTPATRALKNACLAYLGRNGSIYLCKVQYDLSPNMTDRLAALTAIVNGENQALKEIVLAHFYETYQAYPLVMDKWFGTQAASRSSDTFSRVQALLNHPGFNPTNPNKIYNLVLGFANNFAAFHREEGEGYRLLREFITEIDAKNRTVAGRLVKALMNFKQYAEPYRSLMKQELLTLKALPQLSKDVREIVEKALNDSL